MGRAIVQWPQIVLDDSGLASYRARAPQPEGVSPDRCGSALPSWHVAMTHPGAERWAAAELARQGFASYLPLCTVLRRDRVLRTMTRPVEVPLWPRYLLVSFALTDPWGPVQHTRGVARLLMAGSGKPATVPDGLVAAVRATETARSTVPAPGQRWRPGTPCSLTGGVFAGHAAVVLSVGSKTAVVALPIFGMMREALVSLDLLAMRHEI